MANETNKQVHLLEQRVKKLHLSQKLLWALIENDDEEVISALDDGADVNLSSPTGSRPLHVAALRGSDSIINILLNGDVEVNQTDDKGFTPLMVAAYHGKTNAVRILLAKGAKPNECLDTGETALHLAMDSDSQKRVNVVKALLDGGANINAQNKDTKFTPLHLAAQSDARDVADVLLADSECKAATPDSEGRTAAQLARDEGHNSLAEHLSMCTKTRTKADQELVSAVMKLDEEAARSALAAGANASLLSPTGSCLLHIAALEGSASLINILLNHGVKVDQTNLEGVTPLMVAALNGRTDVVTALLANGADKNLKCRNTGCQEEDTGETALHMAMLGGSPRVVKALLEGETDVNVQTTKQMFTPLHFAAQFGARDLMEILKTDPRCDATITDSKRRTAAKLAEESDNGVRELLDTHDGSMTKVHVNHCDEPKQPSQTVYDVTSLPRGKVLILNYERFADETKYRGGAVWDANKLGNLFTEMGYDVSNLSNSRNLDNSETRQLLKSFSEEIEEEVGCAVVCVLSHGKNKNTFVTSDNKEMTVEEVYEFFTDDCCPNLKGKPKLFLFNYCRGQTKEPGCIIDNGSERREDRVPTGINQEDPPTTEILKDYISLYASKAGIGALRYKWKGTYFAEAVMKMFAKHAHDLPVDQLANKLNEHMITMLDGTTISIDSHTLSKEFYLNPTREKYDYQP